MSTQKCASWVSQVTAVSIIGTDDYRPTNLAKILNPNIQLKLTQIDRPTITKHRFIDIGTNAKLFETYDFNPDPISKSDLKQVMENVSRLGNVDVILVADYGHGLLTREFVESIASSTSYLCVNTQANAGNRGYNTITKYPRADFFSANSGELKLEFRSEHIDFNKVMTNLISKMQASKAILTRGAEGLFVYDTNSMVSSPAIATKIVDKVGAGDSVFAIASLLSFIDAPLDIIGLIASLVASHEVSQLGHSNSLTLGDLKKQIRTIMS
jgi:bifunctional ADP-heptose synthase (sugar kinase/adenylyltransferase)